MTSSSGLPAGPPRPSTRLAAALAMAEADTRAVLAEHGVRGGAASRTAARAVYAAARALGVYLPAAADQALPDDPVDLTGGDTGIVDVAGDPRAIGGALVGVDRAVMLDHVAVAVVEAAADDGSGARVLVALELTGRLNRTSTVVRTLHLLDWDGAAALVAELTGVAARAGAPHSDVFQQRLDVRIDEQAGL